VTDHNSNVTTMSYDLLGLKTAMSDPDMGSWQYQYDAVGNLTGQRDTRTLWLYLEYDDLNRLIRKRRDTASTGPLVAEYGYDATGQKGLLSFSKAYNSAGSAVEVETQSMTYDARNRLTRQQWVVNSVGTFRLDYALNEADQPTSLTYPGGTAAQQGEVVSYSYNAIGQLTGVSGSSVQYVSSATYNAQGQLTELRNDTGGNGLTRQFVYETNTLRGKGSVRALPSRACVVNLSSGSRCMTRRNGRRGWPGCYQPAGPLAPASVRRGVPYPCTLTACHEVAGSLV
jgi:YD repeat-containing protein